MATYGGNGGASTTGGTSAVSQNTNQGAGTGLVTRDGSGFAQSGLNAAVSSVGTVIPIQQDSLTGETGTRTTINVTQGYFTNNAGLLEGNNIHTGTLSDSNEQYYFNVTNTHPLSSSAEVQFSVAYAHRGGSGSNVLAGNETKTIKGASEAVYAQFATLLLPENEISGGFKISQQGADGVLASNATDEFIYLLVANRERFKDKLDNKSWTIKLSGQPTTGTDNVGILSLTDDSDSITQTGSFASIVGPRYNIVSGAAGTVYTASRSRTFGHFYPHMGVMVFSGAELSSSIPGTLGTDHITASFSADGTDENFLTSSGFAPNLNDSADCKNGVRFVNCLRQIGSQDIRLRGSLEQDKRSYFCTVGPRQCNFTNNPTFLSQSLDGSNKLRHKSMYGNPNVYITGLGLHDASGQLLAVAKLSTPIQKNYGTQQTIKVNLTY
tara:strand:+ start:231 stop:1544 length:1314 start_codon:yes stop_codon:yes gene_type:complete